MSSAIKEYQIIFPLYEEWERYFFQFTSSMHSYQDYAYYLWIISPWRISYDDENFLSHGTSQQHDGHAKKIWNTAIFTAKEFSQANNILGIKQPVKYPHPFFLWANLFDCVIKFELTSWLKGVTWFNGNLFGCWDACFRLSDFY